MAAEQVLSEAVVLDARPRVDGGPRRWTISPAVVVLALLAAAAALLRLGLTPYGVIGAGSLAVLVVLSAIDIQARILPNKIVLPATAVVLAALAVFYPERLGEAVVAAVLVAALTLAPAVFNPAAMGMGDVKLAGFLGVLLGLDALPALMLGFLATAPVLAIMFVLRGREARRTPIPLGPFLAFGAAIVLLAGGA